MTAKKSLYTGLILFISLITLFTSTSCTGVGIFAVVAVADKIDEGLLPEGISARPVVHIAPDATTDNYYFFASGPGLWAKNNSGNGLWLPTSLRSGGIEWDGVQSMAIAGNRIFLALYDVNGDNYQVAIHTLDSFDGTPSFTYFSDQVWSSDDSGYQTLRLFAPDPAGPVYVDVMNHTGAYASLDEEDQGFTGSNLYTLDVSSDEWSDAVLLPHQEYIDGNNGIASARYITDIADRTAGAGIADDIRMTATNHMFNSNGGILLDGDGNAVTNPDGNPDGSISIAAGEYTNVSVRGISWIPRTGVGNGNGVYLMAATFLDNDTLPVFASWDGNTWVRVGGTTTDYLTTSFIDVSSETAGRSDGKNLVLAGTSSYIDGSKSRLGSGYNEIDITSDTLSGWKVNTSWDDYSFALNTNYSVSELAEATILGMSIPENGDFLYASTRNTGIWKIDLTEDKPSWTRE